MTTNLSFLIFEIANEIYKIIVTFEQRKTYFKLVLDIAT
jgi:hypothetical protein